MILNVTVSESVSLSLPIKQVLDPQKTRLLLSMDLNSTTLLKPGQKTELVLKNGHEIARPWKGSIISVDREKDQTIVQVKKSNQELK